MQFRSRLLLQFLLISLRLSCGKLLVLNRASPARRLGLRLVLVVQPRPARLHGAARGIARAARRRGEQGLQLGEAGGAQPGAHGFAQLLDAGARAVEAAHLAAGKWASGRGGMV